MNWTKAQQQAIETTGRDVLVTASAGTGKTAVLSHRVVERICDPADGAQADSLLVLTFTDAAAEEMRSRIAETLRNRFAAERNASLRQQLLLLDRSYISTIHAFCKRILTEFFYLIDMDPTFGILDADEQRLLKTELLDKTLQQAWEDESRHAGTGNVVRRPAHSARHGQLCRPHHPAKRVSRQRRQPGCVLPAGGSAE